MTALTANEIERVMVRVADSISLRCYVKESSSPATAFDDEDIPEFVAMLGATLGVHPPDGWLTDEMQNKSFAELAEDLARRLNVE